MTLHLFYHGGQLEPRVGNVTFLIMEVSRGHAWVSRYHRGQLGLGRHIGDVTFLDALASLDFKL